MKKRRDILNSINDKDLKKLENSLLKKDKINKILNDLFNDKVSDQQLKADVNSLNYLEFLELINNFTSTGNGIASTSLIGEKKYIKLLFEYKEFPLIQKNIDFHTQFFYSRDIKNKDIPISNIKLIYTGYGEEDLISLLEMIPEDLTTKGILFIANTFDLHFYNIISSLRYLENSIKQHKNQDKQIFNINNIDTNGKAYQTNTIKMIYSSLEKEQQYIFKFFSQKLNSLKSIKSPILKRK